MDKRTIGSILLKNLRKSPDQDVLGWIQDEKVFFHNYKKYCEIVECLVLAFQKYGINKQDKVSILGQTCIEWHLFDMSIISALGVVIPIYPSYLEQEIEYIFKHSESKMIVVEDDEQLQKIINIQEKLDNLTLIVAMNEVSNEFVKNIKSEIKFIQYEQFIKEGKDAKVEMKSKFETLLNEQNEDDIVSIIYTSGTTGEPKGSVITNHAFSSMLDNVRGSFQGKFSFDDCSLVFLPLSHVFGRMDSMVFLVLGYKVVYAESIDKLISNLSIVRPTMMYAVPRIFEKVYAKIFDQIESGSFIKKKLFKWAEKVSSAYYDKIDIDQAPSLQEVMQRKLAYKVVYSKIYDRFGGKVRYFVSGGAPLAVKIIKFFRNANLTVLEGYGLTETIAPCCVNPTWKQIPGTVGIPLGDVQIGFSEEGEILIKSAALLKEYYKDPEQTKEVFKDDWFYTGDIGELTTDGYLKITDRKKDIIITSGGKNVAPQKIESIAKTQKYISHLMVVGDKRKYLTGIVGIEKERFLSSLDRIGLPEDCTVSDLAKNKKVKELIDLDISEINKKLASFETIKKIHISTDEFTVDGGQITPSLKLRKKVILSVFENEINSMYDEEVLK